MQAQKKPPKEMINQPKNKAEILLWRGITLSGNWKTFSARVKFYPKLTSMETWNYSKFKAW